jgi:biotin-(acetyl-CoA carboxylase) ligase
MRAPLDSALIRPWLPETLITDVVVWPETDSTNLRAREAGRTGTAIITDLQTGWAGPARPSMDGGAVYAGIAASVVLPAPADPAAVGWVPLATGLACGLRLPTPAAWNST